MFSRLTADERQRALDLRTRTQNIVNPMALALLNKVKGLTSRPKLWTASALEFRGDAPNLTHWGGSGWLYITRVITEIRGEHWAPEMVSAVLCGERLINWEDGDVAETPESARAGIRDIRSDIWERSRAEMTRVTEAAWQALHGSFRADAGNVRIKTIETVQYLEGPVFVHYPPRMATQEAHDFITQVRTVAVNAPVDNIPDPAQVRFLRPDANIIPVVSTPAGMAYIGHICGSAMDQDAVLTEILRSFVLFVFATCKGSTRSTRWLTSRLKRVTSSLHNVDISDINKQEIDTVFSTYMDGCLTPAMYWKVLKACAVLSEVTGIPAILWCVEQVKYNGYTALTTMATIWDQAPWINLDSLCKSIPASESTALLQALCYCLMHPWTGAIRIDYPSSLYNTWKKIFLTIATEVLNNASMENYMGNPAIVKISDQEIRFIVNSIKKEANTMFAKYQTIVGAYSCAQQTPIQFNEEKSREMGVSTFEYEAPQDKLARDTSDTNAQAVLNKCKKDLPELEANLAALEWDVTQYRLAVDRQSTPFHAAAGRAGVSATDTATADEAARRELARLVGERNAKRNEVTKVKDQMDTAQQELAKPRITTTMTQEVLLAKVRQMWDVKARDLATLLTAVAEDLGQQPFAPDDYDDDGNADLNEELQDLADKYLGLDSDDDSDGGDGGGDDGGNEAGAAAFDQLAAQ